MPGFRRNDGKENFSTFYETIKYVPQNLPFWERHELNIIEHASIISDPLEILYSFNQGCSIIKDLAPSGFCIVENNILRKYDIMPVLLIAIVAFSLAHHYRAVLSWRHFRRHALRNGLQRSDRRDIVKIHGKEELKQVLKSIRIMLILTIFKKPL